MRLTLQILLPGVVLALAGLVSWAIVANRVVPESKPRVESVPVVRVIEATEEPVLLTVEALGTAEPRTETTLVAEVAGRVEELSPSLASGGFFEAGELLLRLDATDYVAAVEEAKAAVARAEAALAREEADADVARREWETVNPDREPTPLARHEPQLAEARANLASARARHEMARRDVERTEIRAPYEGRVRRRLVDLGTYVARGAALADVFAVDYAEVRLSVADDRLPLLDLDLEHPLGPEDVGPTVRLSAPFAGRTRTWIGRIVRAEGALDARTRSVVLVARVEDPYGRRPEGTGPPLLAGTFVDAVIEGRRLDSAVTVPRTAVRSGGQLFVVDGADRLAIRDVETLPGQGDTVVVTAGLGAGERVVTSPLELPVEGMALRAEAESR